MKQNKSSNNIGIVETDSPFISQRTLRKYAQLQRRAPPPPPAPAPIKKVVVKRKPKTIDNAPFGGTYSKATGLVRGPPSTVGVPLFYFDPFSPPNFTEGSYGMTVTKVVEVKAVKGSTAPQEQQQQQQESRKSNLVAPPLPPYVTGKPAAAAAAPVEAAPRKLVINKVKKEAKEEPKATGWQAVMAEMAKKKNGLKAAPKPEEVKPPPKKEEKKVSKKKGGVKVFKDVMEELAYKLAVRRGEIVEEDDDEDEPAEESKTAAAPPAKAEEKDKQKQEEKIDGKPASDGETNKAGSAESKDSSTAAGPKKLPVRADLAAMLSKVLPKGDAKPAAESKDAPAGPKKLAAKPDLAAMLSKVLPKAAGGEDKKPVSSSSSAPSNSSEAGELAAARPASVPAPPPLPSSWPPKPHTGPYPPSTSRNNTNNISGSSTVGNAPSSLPAPVSSSATTSSVSTVMTTSKATQPLPEGYYLASSKAGQVEPCGILNQGSITESLMAELMQQFTEEEEIPVVSISLEQELASAPPIDMARYSSLSETLNIPNKLSLTDLPVPSNYVATVERLKKAADMRVQANAFQRKLELRNYDNTDHDHHYEQQTGGDYMCKATTFKPTQPQDIKFFTEKHFENKVRTFRKEVEKSAEDKLPITTRIESTVTQRNFVYGDNSLDLPTAYFFNSLRSSSSNNLQSSQQQQQHSESSSITSQHQQQQYLFQTPSTPTEPKAPRFRSEEAVQKRQTEKEMRLLYEQQNDDWQRQQTKARKAYLKEKALQTAKIVGVYNPTTERRNRTQQRMIAKYSNRPDVGIDLAQMTSVAREQYYHSTNNSSFATDGTHRTHSAWEYLENESLYTTPYASSSTNRNNPYAYHHYANNQMDIDELVLEEYS